MAKSEKKTGPSKQTAFPLGAVLVIFVVSLGGGFLWGWGLSGFAYPSGATATKHSPPTEQAAEQATGVEPPQGEIITVRGEYRIIREEPNIFEFDAWVYSPTSTQSEQLHVLALRRIQWLGPYTVIKREPQDLSILVGVQEKKGDPE